MATVVTITIEDESWTGGEVKLSTVGNEPQKQIFFVDKNIINWLKAVGA